MSSVHLSGPRNSTMFTDCCDLAINDNQGHCPGCGEEVWPKTRKERWAVAYRGPRYLAPHAGEKGEGG